MIEIWTKFTETVKAMGCGIVVSEFVLQSRYYVHFRANTLGKDMNTLILPAIGQRLSDLARLILNKGWFSDFEILQSGK